MIIDLSALLPHKGEEKNLQIPLEMDEFRNGSVSYRIDSCEPLDIRFARGEGKNVTVDSRLAVTLIIPCDRCLTETKVRIEAKNSSEINLGDTDITQEQMEEEPFYMEGTSFDTRKYAYGEILVNLPMKVLCSENCRGICNRCGTNLNHGECGCDTTELDPRMAKALEVFNSIKEV